MTDDDLKRALREHAYLEGDFVLRSGRRSPYYLDKYRFETRPDILAALGERIAATTAAEPTVGLVFYDLKSALRSIAEKPASKKRAPAATKPAERKPRAPAKLPAAKKPPAKKPAPKKKPDAS